MRVSSSLRCYSLASPLPAVDPLYAYLVALTEGYAIRMPPPATHARMPVLIAVIHIRPSTILKVSPCSLDAVVKTSPRNIVPIRPRSLCPRLVVKSRRRGSLLRLRAGHSKRHKSQTDQYRHHSQSCSHVPSLPFLLHIHCCKKTASAVDFDGLAPVVVAPYTEETSPRKCRPSAYRNPGARQMWR